MKFPIRTLIIVAATLGVVAAGGLAAVYSGLYNVAADDPHSAPVHALLETARGRSIAARAAGVQVPTDLEEPARIQIGAGNYAAMCAGCHLQPGTDQTELSRGLYPGPPNLARASPDAAAAFWVIKHGIKASGMPAWGRSMDDESIWNLVAFLKRLPGLDAAGYAVLVAGSAGHSHGGGDREGAEMDDNPESAPHTHEGDEEQH